MGRQWAGRGLRVNIDDDFQRNQRRPLLNVSARMESQSGKSRLAFGFHLLPFENCHAARKCLFRDSTSFYRPQAACIMYQRAVASNHTVRVLAYPLC